MRENAFPLDSPLRTHLWPQIVSRTTAERVLDTAVDQVQTRKLPRFVDPRLARFFLLNETGRQEVTSVLWQIAQSICPFKSL